mmetsp:Transcript_75920/g.226316  ORF Transcript_75920/g.226316 Transcript_75920/m.226316 type:complete len:325 (+) Transcript_75920:262-1236(+)
MAPAPDQRLVRQVAVGLQVLVQVGPLHDGGQRVVSGQEGILLGTISCLEVLVVPHCTSDDLEVLGHAAEGLLGLPPATLGDDLRALLHDSHLHPAPDHALRGVWDGAASGAGDAPRELVNLVPLLLQVGRSRAALRELACIPAQALDGVGEVVERDPAHVGHLQDVARRAPQHVGPQLRGHGLLVLKEAVGRVLRHAARQQRREPLSQIPQVAQQGADRLHTDAPLRETTERGGRGELGERQDLQKCGPSGGGLQIQPCSAAIRQRHRRDKVASPCSCPAEVRERSLHQEGLVPRRQPRISPSRQGYVQVLQQGPQVPVLHEEP